MQGKGGAALVLLKIAEELRDALAREHLHQLEGAHFVLGLGIVQKEHEGVNQLFARFGRLLHLNHLDYALRTTQQTLDDFAGEEFSFLREFQPF